MRKWVIIFIIIIGFAGYMLWDLSSIEPTKEKIFVLNKGSLQRDIRLIGKLTYANVEDVIAPKSATAKYVEVKKGMMIKEGHVVAGLDNGTVLRAPKDGVVIETIEEGKKVEAGDVIAKIADPDDLCFQVNLTEAEKDLVSTGQEAVIRFQNMPDIKLSGLVTFVDEVPFMTNEFITYIARVSIAKLPEDFRNELDFNKIAEIEILTESKNDILFVPISAVSKDQGENFVFVLQQATKAMKAIPVKLGFKNADFVEVLSSELHEGSLIINNTES